MLSSFFIMQSKSDKLSCPIEAFLSLIRTAKLSLIVLLKVDHH